MAGKRQYYKLGLVFWLFGDCRADFECAFFTDRNSALGCAAWFAYIAGPRAGNRHNTAIASFAVPGRYGSSGL